MYLGGYETAELAALAFDIAVVRFRGRSAQTNYNIAYYEAVLEDLDKVTGYLKQLQSCIYFHHISGIEADFTRDAAFPRRSDSWIAKAQ